MSSETSTSEAPPGTAKHVDGSASPQARSAPAASAADAVPAWQLFALAGLVGATFVVFMSRGQSAPAILLLSLTIFAAAAVGIGALRTLTPLAGEADDLGFDAATLGGRARAGLEREKSLTLRSIKELEFDKAMGKVSDADFADMSARLRTKAVGLMQRLDSHTSYREQIERELEKRLGASRPSAAESSPGVCSTCGTGNDADARFCKACGTSLAVA